MDTHPWSGTCHKPEESQWDPVLLCIQRLWSLPFVRKGRNMISWCEMYVRKFLTPSQSLTTAQLKYPVKIWRHWWILLPSCMTGHIQPLVWMRQDWTWSHEISALMMPYHRGEHPWWNMPNMLPTRLWLSLLRQLPVTQKPAVLPTGSGWKKKKNSNYVGQHSQQLQPPIRGTDQVLLQKGLLQEGQVLLVETPMYCTLQL